VPAHVGFFAGKCAGTLGSVIAWELSVMDERRNYARRRQTLQGALRTLTNANAGPQEATETEAIVRIIKRLAVKGLARWTDGQWTPTLPMMMPATLVAASAAEARGV
jgi:hypothetical protein